MKETLIKLLQALIALARVDPDEQKKLARQQKEIEDLKGHIATIEGDSDLNDPQVKALIDEATQILSNSSPSEDDVDDSEEPDEEEEQEGDQREDAETQVDQREI